MPAIEGTPYEIDDTLLAKAVGLADRVTKLRAGGSLSPEFLARLRRFFKIKNIYNSNAIEGNLLDVGETRLVVEQGLTLTGKPLKDQAEARNLSEAIDFLEELAKDNSRPVVEADIRQLHYLVLKGIRDADAGKYRSVSVEISGSGYKPPQPESVAPQMNEFGNWLEKASISHCQKFGDPLVIAAAAHAWFVTIHPFVDGNGRVGRLLLNLLLMRSGYPIAIITKADRQRYYDALEDSQSSDLTAVTLLIAECVEESLEEYEAAAQEQRTHQEWAQSIVSKFQKSALVRAENQYEVWRNAMELLKSIFKQTAETLSSTAVLMAVWFKDFGNLELEKYLALKGHASAKRTWFFRIDFKSDDRSARYLFFFGSPSYGLRDTCDVSLFVAREEPAGSFNYERLEQLNAPNIPNLVEIGYDWKKEQFQVRKRAAGVSYARAEQICRDFFEDVANRHFSG